MNNRNFPTAAQLATGSNYSLIANRPYGKRIHSDRLIAVGKILNGQDFTSVALEAGCCRRSIKNWVRTFADQTPRLDG